MNAHELKEGIDTWLGLADQPRMPPAPTPLGQQLRAEVEAGWDGALLRNAAALEMVPELNGTVVATSLSDAIRLAKTGNLNAMPTIKKHLHEVQKYMWEHQLG